MVDLSEDALMMEEREEFMVSPIDDEQVIPIFRVAHFLKPTIRSAQKLPFLPSRPNVQELRSCSLKVKFKGGVSVSQLKEWSTWVHKLKPLYQEIWKKAGIFEAIIASTFKIYLHNDLIIALAERWCVETNTFILPWGEVTVTLEDMAVLGGYSVLGHCILNPIKTKKSVEMEKTIREAYKVIRARKKNVTHPVWMEHFTGKGDHLEHVAFLTLWLSRYVLPSRSYFKVQGALFPVAIHLSQGIPVALAPAVLASIYRDLRLLKQFIISSASSRCNQDESDPLFRAPLQFVQLWAWEIFSNLQPKPSIICSGEPRLARWHNVKKINCVDPRSAIDSATDLFLWRPYAIDTVKNWDINKFYKEREAYVVAGPKVGREILIFARLIRASELVGMDCVENYLPHRVSMQFGFDQDVPGCANHTSDTPKIAWCNYDRPITDDKLYIPSRLFESDVTRRYLNWWKNQKFAPEDALKHVTKGQQSKALERMNASVHCEYLQKCNEIKTDGCTQDYELIVVESSDDDNLPISESLCRRKLYPRFGKR
ncbi:protein MAINTENANCE OF MERISTEMS-like [Nicotiana tabacum]|uniref:Protein MAINTENANCE OF MERISTEMS-like n=1 Tax=Nicotiana tabacum TaxID=4097 RepID=A0A1S3WYB6_TOBAC